MKRTIPGVMRYDLLIDRARIAHRPTDQAGLRAAVIELQRSGLKAADICVVLGLNAAAVTQLLQESPHA